MAETQVRAARPMSPRPLSPHLSIFRPLITMTMSIVHRITGAALYFGMVLVAWWLLAAAIGPEAFAAADGFLSSPIGLLLLFGFTWALIHHTLGGIRHMIWDFGGGMSSAARNGLSWATLIGSVILTLLVWVVTFAAR